MHTAVGPGSGTHLTSSSGHIQHHPSSHVFVLRDVKKLLSLCIDVRVAVSSVQLEAEERPDIWRIGGKSAEK